MATTSGSEREREQREKEEREQKEREQRERATGATGPHPTGEQLRGGAPGGEGQQAGNITGAGPSGARGAPAATNEPPKPEDLDQRWYAPPGHSGSAVLQKKVGDVWVDVPTVTTA